MQYLKKKTLVNRFCKVRIDGRMTQIEVGAKGDVYGVSPDGKAYIRDGVNSSSPYGSGWTHLRTASSITTGWTGQYLLEDGKVYRLSGIREFYQSST